MTNDKGPTSDRDLIRLHRVKQLARPQPSRVGEGALAFFKQSVRKQSSLQRVAEAWVALVPVSLNAHCALDGMHRGTLTVLVDGSSFHYELTQLMLAGLEDQLLLACKTAGLRRVALKRGRWYSGDGEDRRVEFKP